MAFNNTSNSHLNQYSALELLFKNNVSAVDFNNAFGGRRVLYGGSMAHCYDYRDAANGSTKGFTKAKNGAKKEVSILGGSITGKGGSYAITIDDTSLEEKMGSWTQSCLYKSKDLDFAGAIKKVYDELFPFIESDPDITADYFTLIQLTKLLTDTGNYEDKLNLYTNALEIINAAKDGFKRKQIPIMEQHIKFFEGFLDELEALFPEFVSQFRRIVEKLNAIGKRNQGVGATIIDAVTKEVIVLVSKLEITNYTKIKKLKVINANSNGVIPLLKLKIGT